jgi:hypothetical protein
MSAGRATGDNDAGGVGISTGLERGRAGNSMSLQMLLSASESRWKGLEGVGGEKRACWDSFLDWGAPVL